MARLKVTFDDDGSRYGSRVKPGRIVQQIGFIDERGTVIPPDGKPATNWVGKRKLPVDDDDRPKEIATERMWSRATSRLVYRAGQEIPEDELPLLIGDAERASEGEVSDAVPVNPSRRKR